MKIIWILKFQWITKIEEKMVIKHYKTKRRSSQVSMTSPANSPLNMILN